VLSGYYDWRSRVYEHEYVTAIQAFDWVLRAVEPRWTLTVHAVPREHRHAIRTLLIAGSLPFRARRWLIDEAPSRGDLKHRSFALSYDLATQTISEGWGG
jgi:hypothetical protein